MAYNDITSRDDVSAALPEDVATEIIKGVTEESAALSLFRRAPRMSSKQKRMPVMAALPQAYFVDGDTGLKQTTKALWDKKFLNAEEIATIVPVPNAVRDDAKDSGMDIWGEYLPYINQAIAQALDNAIFFGVDKPATWPDDIVTAATAAGNTFERTTNNPTDGSGGLAQDISDNMALVEDDGFDVDGHVASRKLKGLLRGARDTTGQQLLETRDGEVYGSPIKFLMRALWGSGSGAPEMISGDFQQGIIAVRQDITVDILTEAALFDNAGALIINLPQQDSTAARIVARYAWQVANIPTPEEPTEADRYPFSVLTAP